MITIYCDFYQLLEIKVDSDTVVVSRIQDYIPLRQQLRRILDEEGRNYTVYVQKPVLAQWLNDLRSYRSHIVGWIEVSLHGYFEQRFGFPPPKELSEAAIQDLLLTLPPTDGNTMADPVGWILYQRIDAIWQKSKPDQNHLVDLAAWLLKPSPIPVLFQPLMRARLMQWRGYDERYQIFLEHPWVEAATSIFIRWVFRHYPKDFTNSIQVLPATPLVDCNRYPAICIELVKARQSRLRGFWNAWLVSSTAPDITIAIQWMSGLADVELDVIEGWARNHQQKVTDQLLSTIRERFSLYPRATRALARLETLVSPPIPNKPDPTWSTEQWLYWVTEEYLPYFAWIIRNNQSREAQIDRALQFERWLLDVYSKLLLDSNAPFSPYQLGRIKELFDTSSVDVVLWFIVDGMTWWQGKKLVDFSRERNIEGIFVHPTISALPTITSISKKALVQGYLDSSDTTQSIAQVLRARFTREAKHIYVYTYYHALEQAFASDLQPGLHALLYNALDHHSHEEQGFTDNESIDGHLKLLSRLIEEGFNICLRTGLRAKAFISSDHGSTLLPANTRVLVVPSFAQILEDESLLEEHQQGKPEQVFQRTRACATDKVPSKLDLDILEQDWYYLEKNAFCLPKQFFIPKGYSAVERRPRGWTHGGATPEEVVVPSIEMQPSRIDCMDPVVMLKGSLQLRKGGTLNVSIGNANVFPIRVVKLIIADIIVETGGRFIGPNASFAIDVTIPVVDIRDATYPVKWFLTCEGGGQRKELFGRVDVPVRRLHVSDVDEMFEDML